jgi:hypothetical protein
MRLGREFRIFVEGPDFFRLETDLAAPSKHISRPIYLILAPTSVPSDAAPRPGEFDASLKP